MKLKQRPEDFRVEELTAATPGDAGGFAFYRLDKAGWTTPDALAAIRRNPAVGTTHERSRARGAPAKAALVAARRKLITILDVILRDQQPWQSA